jgi:hypothetical protein
MDTVKNTNNHKAERRVSERIFGKKQEISQKQTKVFYLFKLHRKSFSKTLSIDAHSD